jgi:hypothetical protein
MLLIIPLSVLWTVIAVTTLPYFPTASKGHFLALGAENPTSELNETGRFGAVMRTFGPEITVAFRHRLISQLQYQLNMPAPASPAILPAQQRGESPGLKLSRGSP